MRQYGIMQRNRDGLHRGPYASRQEADDWINEWLEEGGRPDVFYPVRREVSDWVDDPG
jgi:hypothetical protein